MSLGMTHPECKVCVLKLRSRDGSTAGNFAADESTVS